MWVCNIAYIAPEKRLIKLGVLYGIKETTGVLRHSLMQSASLEVHKAQATPGGVGIDVAVCARSDALTAALSAEGTLRHCCVSLC